MTLTLPTLQSPSPHSFTLASLFPCPDVRRISGRELDWALAEGWKDFLEVRGDVVLLAIIYPLVGFVAAAVSFNVELLPLPMDVHHARSYSAATMCAGSRMPASSTSALCEYSSMRCSIS